MPDPISSTNRSAYECDPAMSSCADRPPATTPPAPSPPIVTIPPVIITGDAGAQELLRRYEGAQACSAERQTAATSCPAIVLGVLNAWEGGPLTGIASALYSSGICGRDLRAFYDCNEQRETHRESLAAAIANCHDCDGVIKPGETSNEFICEIAR